MLILLGMWVLMNEHAPRRSCSWSGVLLVGHARQPYSVMLGHSRSFSVILSHARFLQSILEDARKYAYIWACPSKCASMTDCPILFYAPKSTSLLTLLRMHCFIFYNTIEYMVRMAGQLNWDLSLLHLVDPLKWHHNPHICSSIAVGNDLIRKQGHSYWL